jgi:hypothetical protein
MPVNNKEKEKRIKKLVVEKPNAMATKNRKSPEPKVSFNGCFKIHLEYIASTIIIIVKMDRFNPILRKY